MCHCFRSALSCCTGNEVTKSINQNKTHHAIVFEAVALVLAREADTTDATVAEAIKDVQHV